MADDRHPFPAALHLAERLSGELEGRCIRSKVAGSLRRRRRHVGDIEFVVEPRMVTVDLFGAEAPELEPIRELAESWGQVAKNGDRLIQTKGVGAVGITVELYLVHPPAQWGSILAIRTGPWQLGREAVTRMRRNGFRHDAGHVERRVPGGLWETVPTPTEEDFFRIAGLPCLPPARRDEWRNHLEGSPEPEARTQTSARASSSSERRYD